MSRTVDSEAEAVRLRTDSARNAELLEAMEQMKAKSNTQESVLPCYYIPFGLQERLLERESIVEELRKALGPIGVIDSHRCVILHGLGGVGKTRIALEYATNARNQFDAIFWISADNMVKLTQGFSEVSRRLSLTRENNEPQDAASTISSVRTWLADTCK